MHRRGFIAASAGGLIGAVLETKLRVPLADSLESQGRGELHPQGGYKVYVVPHSHQSLEWFWTFDQQKALSIKDFCAALEMLKKDPHYAFTQDYKILLKVFWDTLSASDRDFLRHAIKEGRFEVATGMYDQPDYQAPDFESLTRQFLFGKPWEEEVLGVRITTAWNIDVYGHPPQMPQMFHKAGIPYYVFMRGVLPSLQNSVKSPFYWKSPCGDKVLAYWLSSTYALNTKDPTQPGPLGPPLKVLVDHNVEGNDKIMVPWGRDFYDPDQTSDQIELLIRKSAEELEIPIKSVIVTTPSHYFRDVEKSAVSLPTYTYDFNPPLLMEDLRGQYGERPAGKLAERQAEERLEASEKFSSIAGLYGQSYPNEQLQTAWQKVLFDQEHDQVPGSHPDDVDKETMSRYHAALEIGTATLNEALYALSRKVDTSTYGNFPFLVFNCLSYPRTEVVHYEPAVSVYKDTSGSETTNFRILDDMGNVQPFWLVSASHYSRFLSMAVVEFTSRVPALGYRLYRIEKMEGEAQPQRWHVANEEISNRFFTLHLDRTTGLISSLVDRRSGKELLNTTHYGGNEVVLKEEKNPELEGPIHFTGDEIRTRGIQPDCTQQVDQPFGSRFRIQRPFLGGLLTQEIALYNELPRIDFKVKLLGFPGHDGMLMVVFPLRGGASMESYYEPEFVS